MAVAVLCALALVSTIALVVIASNTLPKDAVTPAELAIFRMEERQAEVQEAVSLVQQTLVSIIQKTGLDKT